MKRCIRGCNHSLDLNLWLLFGAACTAVSQDVLPALQQQVPVAGTGYGGVPGTAQCPCGSGPNANVASPQQVVAFASATGEQGANCQVSKVSVHQDHQSSSGLQLPAITSLYANDAIVKNVQPSKVRIAAVSTVSFMCMDDRVTEPSLATPGGDLGEFILAIASHLQDAQPTQQVVDYYLQKYVETLPASRPLVHCTDDRALSHLEGELPVENLDIRSPPEHVKQEGLLQRLVEFENQGDSHIRLMLKQPEWFQLNNFLVPMVLRSFYSLLWRQHQDPGSSIFHAPKLKLQVLSGESNPQAFLEVVSAGLCHGSGAAPLLTPRDGQRAVLISNLDAVSLHRAELAAFFASQRTAPGPQNTITAERLRQRLDRHGWLALETTGSRIADGLPFYTLTYM
mmetsp:Transcript_25418/g.49771  ORF Transcript_25418/g.49771 Transcript_25418/m.49771 type:complete len:397 (+) Transcript_25418:141-1331(+)